MNKYTVLFENNDLFGVLGVFCNGHCAQNCCRISKQTSGGFRTCLGGKKISELFWEIRPGSPPTFNKTAENRTFVCNGRNFCARHRTRKLISGGFRACHNLNDFFRNQGSTPMPSHTFPVLYHASAQPRRGHSKNLERVLRRNNNKGT